MNEHSIVENVDLDILKRPESNRFLDEIQGAYVYLTEEQTVPFFNIVLSHFDKELQIDKGKEILHCIARILSVDKFLRIFVRKNFAISLPFMRKEYIDDVFDILYILATRCPNAFNDQLCACFEKRIKNRGEKSLVILTIYAQHFNDVDTPWPMLDLLFHKSDRFKKPDLAAKYASLLAVLVNSYPEFKRGRGKESWETIVEMLAAEDYDNKILKALYNALCTIARFIKNPQFPFNIAKKHLQIQDLASDVVSLFLMIPLRGKDIEDRILLKTLLKLAQSNSKVTLALFKLAENENVAKMLAEDSIWLTTDIPQTLDTLR